MLKQSSTPQLSIAPKMTPAPGGVLQRACACGNHTIAGDECAECRKKREGTLQRASLGHDAVSEVPPIVHEVLRSPGQPLDAATRTFMEPRFGHDFSGVRVHTDSRAADSARAVDALAYTAGRDVVFGKGQYVPSTAAGKHLLAHELTHVVQQQHGQATKVQKQAEGDVSGSALEDEAKEMADELDIAANQAKEEGDVVKGELVEAAAPGKKAPTQQLGQKPPAAKKACTGDVDPDKIIVDHTVTPTVIEKPGDKVTFTVTFACTVKGDGFSKFVAPDGSEFGRKSFSKGQDQIKRTWDGKKLFSKVGTFVVDDGDYIHRLEPVKYTIKSGKDLFTTGSKHDSPTVKVKVRSFKGSGADHFHFTTENVKVLAKIIETEMGGENDTAKKAVAWAVRNQMIRMGTDSVQKAANEFKDRHGKAASGASTTMAEEILKKPMSDDFTQGAIKWFSPNAQPKEGEKCSGEGCDGGLDIFTDQTGKKQKVWTPAFHKDMTYVSISGIHEWRVRFYKL